MKSISRPLQNKVLWLLNVDSLEGQTQPVLNTLVRDFNFRQLRDHVLKRYLKAALEANQ